MERERKRGAESEREAHIDSLRGGMHYSRNVKALMAAVGEVNSHVASACACAEYHARACEARLGLSDKVSVRACMLLIFLCLCSQDTQGQDSEFPQGDCVCMCMRSSA